MTTQELLLEQFAATYDERNWFVTIKEAVDGLTPEQASWRDNTGNHSIHQIVEHLIFWNERYLMRLNDITPPKMTGENDDTFNSAQNDWNVTLKKIQEVFDGLRRAISKVTEESVSAKIKEYYGAPWDSIMANINIHNAYHIGQIVYIRKLQGSWDSNKGAK